MAYVGLDGRPLNGWNLAADAVGLGCGSSCGCASCRSSPFGESYVPEDPEDASEPSPSEPETPEDGEERKRPARSARPARARRRRLRPRRRPTLGYAGYPLQPTQHGFGEPSGPDDRGGSAQMSDEEALRLCQRDPGSAGCREWAQKKSAELERSCRQDPGLLRAECRRLLEQKSSARGPSNAPRMGPQVFSPQAYARETAKQLDQLYRRAQAGDAAALAALQSAIDKLLGDRAQMQAVGRELRELRSPAALILRVPKEPPVRGPDPPRRWSIPPRTPPRAR